MPTALCHSLSTPSVRYELILALSSSGSAFQHVGKLGVSEAVAKDTGVLMPRPLSLPPGDRLVIFLVHFVGVSDSPLICLLLCTGTPDGEKELCPPWTGYFTGPFLPQVARAGSRCCPGSWRVLAQAVFRPAIFPSESRSQTKVLCFSWLGEASAHP